MTDLIVKHPLGFGIFVVCVIVCLIVYYVLFAKCDIGISSKGITPTPEGPEWWVIFGNDNWSD